MDETDITLFKKKKKRDKNDSGDESDNEVSSQNAPDMVDGKVNPTELPKISIPAESCFYGNDNAHTGFAIIFNHEIIKGESPRKGTEKDRNHLTKCLRALGFFVVKHDDLTFEELTDVLEEASRQDYSDYDCFCITVLSHGETGKVYAKDMAYPVERLWKPFLGNNCRSLINKPKIFFIQACRGEKFDSGVQYRGFTTMSRGLDIPDAGPQRLATFAIPSTADLLIMYSTYEGNYSWRNPVNGSWFIQSLCAEIENFIQSGKCEMDLFHLLTAVCRKVAYEYQSNVPGNDAMDEMKEMPQIVSTLTKIFYLRIRN